MADTILTCTPKSLPKTQILPAAQTAVGINPLNRPHVHRLAAMMGMAPPDKMRIAVVTSKYWGAGGVRLTVGFLDTNEAALRNRILQHMNAWSERINANFVLTNGADDADVRIARVAGDGYWSYVGTDIRHIARGKPTMNLDSFTMSTSESEYHRVVRHETGHTLGCPHEHMRRALVNKIDPDKAITYFGQTQGWTADEVRAQVLTPLEDAKLRGTSFADEHSIMCYQIPGVITKDGKPIIGGTDIDASDFDFMAGVYPKPAQNPPRAAQGTKKKVAAKTKNKKKKTAKRKRR
jgi:Astacin (Peptidase family M12A)